MKKALAALFLAMLTVRVYASDKWNDALSTPTPRVDPIQIHTDLIPSSSQTVSSTVTGRQIIIAHLEKIKSSDLIINTVALEPYWQGVFASAGHPELYLPSQHDIQVALDAGLSPYLRGDAVSAEQFADAALAALQHTSSTTVASTPEKTSLPQ